MTTRKILSAVAVTLLVLTGCGLVNQLGAKTVMVSTILSTPEIEVKAAAIAGLDASIPVFDAGGFVFDAGGFDPKDAGILVPPQTVAFSFFGSRTGEDIASPPTGVTGAVITVGPRGGTGATLNEIGMGTYQLTSLEDGGLTYPAGADIDFIAKSSGQTYTARVEKAPPQERISQFHPAAGYIELTAGDTFSFTRPDPPAGQERNLGFVIVVPISRDGKQGDPTYTNLPKQPVDYLKLVVAPNDWRTTSVTVPSTAFPEKEKNYLLILQSAKLGGPVSENLFTGSAIIAGAADVAIIKTRP